MESVAKGPVWNVGRETGQWATGESDDTARVTGRRGIMCWPSSRQSGLAWRHGPLLPAASLTGKPPRQFIVFIVDK